MKARLVYKSAALLSAAVALYSLSVLFALRSVLFNRTAAEIVTTNVAVVVAGLVSSAALWWGRRQIAILAIITWAAALILGMGWENVPGQGRGLGVSLQAMAGVPLVVILLVHIFRNGARGQNT